MKSGINCLCSGKLPALLFEMFCRDYPWEHSFFALLIALNKAFSVYNSPPGLNNAFFVLLTFGLGFFYLLTGRPEKRDKQIEHGGN